MRRGARPVLLARLRGAGLRGAGPDDAAPDGAEFGALFTDRLVAKFGLPVAGWRGQAAARRTTGLAGQREEGPSSDA